MLFAYPTIASEQNWLHECLREMLQTVHSSLDRGTTPPDWDNLIPKGYQQALKSRTSLRDAINRYRHALDKLPSEERERIYEALIDQNRIPDLLQGRCDCDTITDLPEPMRQPILDLFRCGFRLLTEFEIRDEHYSAIYDRIPAKMCPFCGLELFDAPTGPREALDHYLPESLYPFAAANLYNLIPMGNKCNSRHKLATDILRKNGVRRKSFDPYNPSPVAISLEKSRLFARDNETLPAWSIEFVPDTEEAETWNDVFHIRERYERDILNPSFKVWIGHFQAWYRISNIPVTSKSLEAVVLQYIDLLGEYGYDDQSFLKIALFRLFHLHIQQDNQRLINLLLGVLT